jgi:hypothetical protein
VILFRSKNIGSAVEEMYVFEAFNCTYNVKIEKKSNIAHLTIWADPIDEDAKKEEKYKIVTYPKKDEVGLYKTLTYIIANTEIDWQFLTVKANKPSDQMETFINRTFKPVARSVKVTYNFLTARMIDTKPYLLIISKNTGGWKLTNGTVNWISKMLGYGQNKDDTPSKQNKKYISATTRLDGPGWKESGNKKRDEKAKKYGKGKGMQVVPEYIQYDVNL